MSLRSSGLSLPARVFDDKFFDSFRLKCCPVDTPSTPIAFYFFSDGLCCMLEEIVAHTAVDVAEMFNGAFPFHQGGVKLGFEASCPTTALFGVSDKLCGQVAVMHDPVASVAEEFEIAEISDALTTMLYLVVKNLMHAKVMAARLIRLPPVTDFAKSRIAHHAQLLPNPRIKNVVQCLMRQFRRAWIDSELKRVHCEHSGRES